MRRKRSPVPPQIFRFATAGRSACSARQLNGVDPRVVQEAEERGPLTQGRKLGL